MHRTLHSARDSIVISTLLALCITCTSVFPTRISRDLHIGAFPRGSLIPLRAIQSGHPGDYALWLTIGTASATLACLLFLG